MISASPISAPSCFIFPKQAECGVERLVELDPSTSLCAGWLLPSAISNGAPHNPGGAGSGSSVAGHLLGLQG
jgi:hypothetical protein